VPASPVIVASQLPDNHPAKKRAMEYTALYESANGPGSVEFRRALRDALEATRNLEVSNGAVNMSKTDHLGLDARARVMVQIQNGRWVLQK